MTAPNLGDPSRSAADPHSPHSDLNATLGFSELGELTQKQPKSLMRMLSPNGNPHARNLFEVIGCIQRYEGFQLEVKAVR